MLSLSVNSWVIKVQWIFFVLFWVMSEYVITWIYLNSLYWFRVQQLCIVKFVGGWDIDIFWVLWIHSHAQKLFHSQTQLSSLLINYFSTLNFPKLCKPLVILLFLSFSFSNGVPLFTLCSSTIVLWFPNMETIRSKEGPRVLHIRLPMLQANTR